MNPKYIVDDVKTLARQAIERGAFYLLPPGKEYEDATPLQHLHGLPRLGKFSPNGHPPQGSIMPCPGILNGSHEGLREVAEGLSNHFGLVQTVLPYMRQWLVENLTPKTLQALEMEHFFTNPHSVALQPESLVRADLVKDAKGHWRSCDPNAIPLGMAFIKVYDELLKNVWRGEMFPRYTSQLVGAGRVAIVTTFNYPNWSSHAYIANLVTQSGGDMVVVPPDLLYESGIDGIGLKALYVEMGWLHDHIPNSLYKPDVLIRYVREEIPNIAEVRVVNAPGTRLVEAQLLTTLSFLPGIEHFSGQLDLETIRRAVVPGLMLRERNGYLEVATLVHSSNFQTVWRPFGDNLHLLDEISQQVGVPINRKTKWVVKAAFSSGFKGVRMSDKGGLQNAEANILQTIAGFIPNGEVFFVQPRISSELEVCGEVRRTKLDLYMLGSSLHPCAADLMSTPKSQIAVHGGSGTDFWLVDL